VIGREDERRFVRDAECFQVVEDAADLSVDLDDRLCVRRASLHRLLETVVVTAERLAIPVDGGNRLLVVRFPDRFGEAVRVDGPLDRCRWIEWPVRALKRDPRQKRPVVGFLGPFVEEVDRVGRDPVFVVLRLVVGELVSVPVPDVRRFRMSAANPLLVRLLFLQSKTTPSAANRSMFGVGTALQPYGDRKSGRS